MAEGCKMTDNSQLPSRGFTFTISALLISVTLLSMAAFSQEWRRGQQSPYVELAPSDAIRTSERVSSDFAAVLGATAEARRLNATSAWLRFSGTLPLGKEGSPVSQLSDYSSSLASSLRSRGFEATIYSGGLAGQNATAITAAGSGRLEISSDGNFDSAVIYHPSGWTPSAISIQVSCGKSAAFSGEPLADGSGGNLRYSVGYSQPDGTKYLRTLLGSQSGNLSFTVSFADGSRLVGESRFSAALPQNYTALRFTKSPSPLLVLPFEEISASAGSDITDLSPYRRPLLLGGGTAANSPALVPGCRFGYCYSFDGLNDRISGDNLAFTDFPLSVPQGNERVQNGGFETPSSSPLVPDDDVVDSWANWTLVRNNPTLVFFDSTADSWSGLALKVKGTNPGCAALEDFANQSIPMQGNVLYTLSFMTHGDSANGGGYRIYDPASGLYLQPGGNWAASATPIPTGNIRSVYTQVVREFSLPATSNAGIQLHLMPPSYCGSGFAAAYYDSVSIRRTDGLNGGFESYYYDHVN